MRLRLLPPLSLAVVVATTCALTDATPAPASPSTGDGGIAAATGAQSAHRHAASTPAGSARTRAATSWRDDFTTFDTSTWQKVNTGCYLPQNATVSGGMLRLTIAPSALADCPGVTGARVNSYGLRDWAPGTFRARIKYVLAPGSWQTFWMTGANGKVFPGNGEIDVAEIIGRTPHQTHVNLHSARLSDPTRRCSQGTAPSAQVNSVWHVYGVITSKTAVTFTIDGRVIGRFTPNGTCAWPFGDRMRMIFSSRGGEYGGDVDPSAYPVTYLVDWVTWHAA
jgi:beta-glucanase (GH16 family)